MIDPIAASFLAISSRSPAAVGLVFAAGLITSIGPCVAPRYLAVAAFANGSRAWVPTLAFVTGLFGAFVALGWSAALLGSVWASSRTIDIVLAVALAGGGIVTLVRASATADCDDRCRSRTRTPRSLGGILLLGAASALVVSPCCTPVVLTVVAASTAIGQPLLGVVLLAAFTLGHAAPLFLAGGMLSKLQRVLGARVPAQAPAIVAGTLLLALGAYYGVLA